MTVFTGKSRSENVVQPVNKPDEAEQREARETFQGKEKTERKQKKAAGSGLLSKFFSSIIPYMALIEKRLFSLAKPKDIFVKHELLWND